MQVISHALTPASRTLIRNMWMVEEDCGLDISVLSFPVGYPFLNIINGRRFRIAGPDRQEVSSFSYLAGLCSRPFHLQMPLISRALTVQLSPYAIPFLFGVDASACRDHVLPLSDLDPRLADRLETLLASGLSSARVMTACEAELVPHSRQQKAIDPRIPQACREILLHGGTLPVKALSERLHVSMRRLQQLFREQVGFGPKTYSRIVKMQRHTYQLLQGEKLDDLVPDSYYDQSHFIHDLKRQTGMLPAEFSAYIRHPSRTAAYLSSNIYRGS